MSRQSKRSHRKLIDRLFAQHQAEARIECARIIIQRWGLEFYESFLREEHPPFMNQTGKAILDDIPEVILESLIRNQTSNQAESYE
jgi:hypothetical protein